MLGPVRYEAVSADDDAAGKSSAEALREAISALGLEKSEAVVLASREMLELRTIQVPRMEAEELPDIIRYQAQRQFAQINENWVVDFVMLPDRPADEMQTALVAALNPVHMSAIETACRAAQVELQHVAMEPLEIARFGVETGQIPRQGVALAACLSETQAEIVLYRDGRVILVRGTRLPHDTDQRDKALRSEITRTMVAAGPLLDGAPVAGALLMAHPLLAENAQSAIAEVVGITPQVIDPSSLLSAEVAGISPDALIRTAGHRVVALAGAGAFMAASPDTKIDFKHPKRRPPKRQNRTRIALAATAALLLVIAGGSWWYSENSRLNEELADLEAQIESKQGLLETAQKRVAELREIDKFLQGSPNFLAELAYVAERIPPADKVLISAPRMNTTSDGIGIMAMNIAADSAATISQFEESLRDEHHIVKGSNYEQLDEPDGLYKWIANERVAIHDRGWKLVQQLTGPGAAPPAGKAGQSPPPGAPEPAPSSAASSPAEEQTRSAVNDADTSQASQQPTTDDTSAGSSADGSPATEQSDTDVPPANETQPPAAPIPDENKRASSETESGSAA
ncbi:MAG: hypothetical protein D6753_06905 [Planctomycetota bacterium]|nr:MAG: hypothetical protein D6753_06905 [Planctomycetota bacterium]